MRTLRAATPSNAPRLWTSGGIDFVDACEVFDGPTVDFQDGRKDYGEPRFVTAGHLRGRMMVVVWTPRGDARHIISMRKANERQTSAFWGGGFN